ncbi:T9SS type A sorting domain-containing protein [bacterium]|nr:T9SS type A sorting domain-containing protein [bacterium]
MKAYSIYITALVVALIAVSCQSKKHNEATEEVVYHQNPGYYEQWFTMKKNENGEIPSGLYTKWYNYEKSKAYKRKPKSGLSNVVEIGPANVGGRTMDILVDRADYNRVIAASNSGGLWQSKTNGAGWKPMNDWASNLTTTCLEQSPFEYNIIYYGTGIAAGGIGVPGEGIFKSTDGGDTFEQLDTTLNFGNIWDIEHSLTDSNTLYVATASNGLWRTTDGGKTFEKLLGMNGVSDLETFPDGSVLVAVISNGIYRSETGEANTFEKITKGTPTGGYNRLVFDKCDDFPKVVFANFTVNIDGENGKTIGVWKSSNGGKTWHAVDNPSNGTNASFAQPWFTLALGVDPHDSQKVVTGCRDFVFSTNGGQSWKRGNNGHPDHHVYTFRRDRPGYFYLGCDGGIYEYNWQTIATRYVDKNNGYNVTQFYAGSFMPDSLGTLGGAQDNGTNYSLDGREKFVSALGGDGAFCHIHQGQPTVAYMSSQNGAIAKTTHLDYDIPTSTGIMNQLDGDHNGQIDDGAWFINPFEMNYLNSEMLFFPTRRRIFFSYDGGGSWYPLTDYKVNLYAVGIPNNHDPKRIYFGGDNLGLWRIDDLYAAEPGDEVSITKSLGSDLNGGFISSITVHPRNDGILYITLSNYSGQARVWRVDDADTDKPKWKSISGDLPKQLPANWLAVDPYRPDSFFIIGTDFGLYTTQNGGQTWVKDEQFPNVVVQQVRLRYTDRKLFVYTHGRGIFTADLKKMKDPFIGVPPSNTLEVSIYPNPATNFLKINSSELLQYEIADLSGKTIMRGNTQGTIDIQQLSKGKYIINLQNNLQSGSYKFVKD